MNAVIDISVLVKTSILGTESCLAMEILFRSKADPMLDIASNRPVTTNFTETPQIICVISQKMGY